jgi:hypothetical protein
MKRLLLLVVLLSTALWADEITFTTVGPGTITSGLSGMSAGPASVVLVTDVTTGKSITLTDTFTSSAGAAHSVTLTGQSYTAFFSSGVGDSVDIPGEVTGNLLDNSELTAIVDGAGSFSGEFDVTFLNPMLLKEFGLGPKFSDTGSVGITFHDSDVTGHSLTGNIGGGSTTVLTLTTPIPEPVSLLLLGTGILVIAKLNRFSNLSVR